MKDVESMVSPWTLKSLFSGIRIDKGKLLGHIASKGGISIDLERIQSIKDVRPPVNKKSVQSFFGKIKFVRRFVLDYASIVKPLNKLFEKDQSFEWIEKSQKALSNIKSTISTAPVMVNLDFYKDFILYYFSSYETIAAILTQMKDKKEEHPISFMIKGLQ